MAIHSPIWPSLNPQPELTLLLTTPEFKILHLCIPINLTNSDDSANPFLRYWLYDESPLPSGFTVNEILNFSQPTVSFATLQYCLKYNNSENITPYLFCLFKDGLNINASKAPAWMTKLSTPDKLPVEGSTDSYMRKTSDNIFNLMMHGQFRYFMRDVKDPRLVSLEQHFSDDRTQDVIKPVIYTVKRELLFKKKTKEGFSNPGQIDLQNVKCYPINLKTQIDDNGKVVIDQTTNKPVDISSIDSVKSLDPSLALNAKIAAQVNNNNIRFYVVLGIIALIVICFTIVMLIYIYTGASFAAPAEAVAGAASVPSTPVSLPPSTP